MKKILLFAAAALVASSASAAEVVLAETDFATASGYNFWKSDVTNAEIKDGGLTITNDAAAENFWDVQYMVADNFTLVGGTEYTVNVKIKGFSGKLHYNMGTWGSNVNGEAAVEEAADWQNVVFAVTAKEDTDGTAHLLLQSGDFVGSYTIANVKITYNDGQGGGDTPVEPTKNVIASMYPGDAQFIAWGCDGLLTQDFEIDGRTAAKFAQTAEGKNPWEVQFAYDYDYVPGTKYYFSFEVKGAPDGSVSSGFQCTDGYVGCGDVESFNITSDWNKVVVSGTPTATEDGKLPNRWVASIGTYVGTFYISNVEIYTLEESGVDSVVAPVKVNTGVYNLQGVKVADSLDEVVAPGLYISNGKKIIKK